MGRDTKPVIPRVIRNDLEVLRRFNRRVDRLEQSGFWKRYEREIPNAIAKFENVRLERTGETQIEIIGQITSWLADFNQDEIDAFVLTYRIFTQNNDQLSIGSLARIYAEAWMPDEARSCFADARQQLNDELDSYAKIDFGDGHIRLRTLVDIVIYGGLAHSSPHKAQVFETWETSGLMGFVWAEFFGYAREAVTYLQYFRSLNAALLQHAETYGFEPASAPNVE